MLIPALIGLIISLTVLYVVYLVVNWILGQIGAPAISTRILYIIFAVLGVVILLRFVLQVFGGTFHL